MAVEMASQLKGSFQVAVGSLDRINSAGCAPGLWVQGASISADGLALVRLLAENRKPRQLEGLGGRALPTCVRGASPLLQVTCWQVPGRRL